MAFYNVIFGLLVLAVPGMVRAEPPELLGRKLDSLFREEQELSTLQQAWADTAASISRQIGDVRGPAGTPLRPWQRLRLERLMAAAKGVSDRMTRTARLQAGIRKELRDGLARAVRTCGTLLNGDQVPAALRETCTRKVPGWQKRLADLERPPAGTEDDGLEQFRVKPNDDLFSLQNKMTILRQWQQDLEADLKQEGKRLEELKSELRTVEAGTRFSYEREGPGDDPADRDPQFGNGNAYYLEIQIKNTEDKGHALKEKLIRITDRLDRIRARIGQLTE